MASPMPIEAPVTTTTFPETSTILETMRSF
jgi:hypothetical protein